MKDKKYIKVFILFLMVFLLFPSTILGDTIPEERQLPRLVDNAELLTDEEFDNLLAKLDEVSERQNFDIVIATVNTLGGLSPTEFADDFFDYNGYGMGKNHDGIILLLSMEERDWAISTHGFGINAFTDSGQRHMMDSVLDYLSDGNYYDGFNTYIEFSDDYITQAREDKPYDNNNLPKAPLSPIWIPISIGGGMIIAFIITAIMKGQLKSVRMKRAATGYIRDQSMNLRRKRDLYLYSSVTRTPRPKNNSPSGGSSIHRSSSGRSHGGSSGKF